MLVPCVGDDGTVLIFLCDLGGVIKDWLLCEAYGVNSISSLYFRFLLKDEGGTWLVGEQVLDIVEYVVLNLFWFIKQLASINGFNCILAVDMEYVLKKG